MLPTEPTAAIVEVPRRSPWPGARFAVIAGLALVVAALAVPLATPYAVLLAVIGITPLVVVVPHPLHQVAICVVLFWAIALSGALDRRKSVEVHRVAANAWVVEGDRDYLVVAGDDGWHVGAGRP